MSEKIFRVASVIDEYNVVINCGSKNGIKEGYRFLIYGIGNEIFDPESKESLGNLEIVRGTGKAVHVQEKMCTIKSDMCKKIPSSIVEKRRIPPSRSPFLFQRMSLRQLKTKK